MNIKPIVSNDFNCFVRVASSEDYEVYRNPSTKFVRLEPWGTQLVLNDFHYHHLPLYFTSNLYTNSINENIDKGIFNESELSIVLLIVYIDDFPQESSPYPFYKMKLIESKEDEKLLYNFKWRYKGYLLSPFKKVGNSQPIPIKYGNFVFTFRKTDFTSKSVLY